MMPELILYLLKVNMALLLFFAGYCLILQRYTFHTLNRFYLLTGLVYSALYPLVDLSKVLERNRDLKDKIGVLAPDWQGSLASAVTQAEDKAGNYWQAMLFIFWLGVIVMALRLMVQLVSLLTLHLRSTSSSVGGFRFRRIPKTINPFSFWRTIYVNPECHDAAELRSILEHEQVHVKQLHTLDILLAELSTIFYWFNPGVWLMKKAIKANLEFITDQAVINSGIDSKEYQYALLKSQVLAQDSIPVVNNFHFLTIKKRIAMINKRPSSRVSLSNYLLILPGIMVAALVLAAPRTVLSKGELVSAMVNPFANLPHPAEETHITLPEKPDDEAGNIKDLNTRKTESPDAGADTISTRNPPGNINDVRALSDNTSGKDTTKNEPAYFVNRVRIYHRVNTINPDSIAAIDVEKGPGTTIDNQEVRNGVIHIRTKSFVRSQAPSTQNSPASSPALNLNEKNPLSDIDAAFVIIDGVEVSKNNIKDLTAADIKRVEVLKGAPAIAKYGERAGKGVIILTTKK